MKRSPQSIPELNRVDVRTFQPLEIKTQPSSSNRIEPMNHTFAKSEVWQQILNRDHPILKNHKAFDQHLLPGLAYIDLLYQWFGELGYEYQQLELRNLSIFRPLIVGEGRDIELSITAEEKESGCWKVIVSGFPVKDSSKKGKEETYITAECHKVDGIAFEEEVDPDSCLGNSQSKQDLEEMYQECRKMQLIHTDMMKGQGTVFTDDRETWIRISVNDQSKENTDSFLFHPVLIDGSGVGSMKTIAGMVEDEDRLFLPLFFESFKAVEPLQTECITRIKHKNIQLQKELIKSTMEFFNASGRKIGELKNFNNKLVREKELITEKPKQSRQNGKTLALSNDFDSVDSFIQTLIASKLEKPVSSINVNVGYYEMGLDSAMLLEVVQEIESQFSISLPPTLLFEFTTIASLADHLSNEYSNDIQFQDAKKPSGREFKKAPSTVSQLRNSRQPLPTHAAGTSSPVQTAAAHISNRDIAVIGMAGRYPQARNIGEFWENLKAGKDCITEIPSDRWDWKQFEGTTFASGKSVSRWGGFVEDADCFDPLFFRISPLEAEALDPQERTFLEVCWETMEDAGYTSNNIVQPRGEARRKMVGVFAGVMHKDYTLVEADANAQGQQVPLSLNYAQIANRVSYFCNFHGPSTVVDTVCSSSLTAVHLAINSLILEECEVAFAGGVNLSLHPGKYETYGMVNLHSSDGRCRAFGEGGDGYVSGEGIGAVLLKPLEKAVQDGDHIYAVIKGSKVNHVGSVSGFTVPSPVAQAELISDCLDKADVDPESISYIETHGTGTILGDPIEIQGLIKAFQKRTDKKQFCALGSVKSNIGHAESAAGISGLTKAILQLHHKKLVPSLHCNPINPLLNLEGSPFYVQKENEDWVPSNGVRRAGISSFGATGSNVHVILEEFQQETEIQTELDGPVLLPLSAKTPERLQTYAAKLLDFIQMNQHEIDLAALVFTLQTGREAMDERLILLASNLNEAIGQLKTYLSAPESGSRMWYGNINTDNSLLRFFQSDGDLKEAMEQWMLKGKLDKVAELWAQGCDMDWELLHQSGHPLRMSLPTYPFTRDRYWVDVDMNAVHVNIDPSGQAASSGDINIEVQLPETMQKELKNNNSNKNLTASSSPRNDDTSGPENKENFEQPAESGDSATNETIDIKAHIREIVATTIKLKPEQIQYTKALYEYGVDSIIFMKLNNFFEDNFATTFNMTEWDEKWSIEQIYKELKEKAGDLSLKNIQPDSSKKDDATGSSDATSIQPSSIPTVQREKYPLSSTQKSLYFLYLSAPKEPNYNMSVTYRLKGLLDEDAIKRTLEEMVHRHEVLRTHFILEKGEAFQVVANDYQLSIISIDLTDLSPADQEMRLEAELTNDLGQAFDLSKELPLRALIIRKDKQETYIRLTSHHIVFDTWSMGVFSYEMGALYNAFVKNTPSPLKPLAFQYSDFSVYQQEQLLSSTKFTNQLNYWKNKLAHLNDGTLLPADKERPVQTSFEGKSLPFSIPKTTIERLKKLGSEHGASLYMILLSIFQALLHRYTGQSDITIGTPIANRVFAEMEGMVGFFANTLAMRTQVSDMMPFSELLQDTRLTVKEAYENKDLPFEVLVGELNPERKPNMNPFFQIAFVMQNVPFQELEMTGLELERLDDQVPTVRFDLEIGLWETELGVEGSFNFRTCLFEQERIERLMEHYTNLIDAVIRNFDLSIADYVFIDTETETAAMKPVAINNQTLISNLQPSNTETENVERGVL